MACLGLPIHDAETQQFINDVVLGSEGRRLAGGAEIYTWTDPGGAMVTVRSEKGEAEHLVASFQGPPGVSIGTLDRVGDGYADVFAVDESGDIVTRKEVELVPAYQAFGTGPWSAQLTAFGRAVRLYRDEADFMATDPRLLMAESLIAWGGGFAWLHGTVLAAERRTTFATGQSFVHARVRTVHEIQVDLCVADEPDMVLPIPGNVMGGDVHLVLRVDLGSSQASDR